MTIVVDHVGGTEPDVRQVQGQGVSVTFGNLTLLCAPEPGQAGSVGALVGTLAAAAQAESSGGRRLSQLLAKLLGSAGPSEFPALCAFGQADDGMTAIVYGSAQLVLTVGGRELCLEGRSGMSLVDRFITEPVEAIRATIGDPDTGLRVEWATSMDAAGDLAATAAPSVEPTMRSDGMMQADHLAQPGATMQADPATQPDVMWADEMLLPGAMMHADEMTQPDAMMAEEMIQSEAMMQSDGMMQPDGMQSDGMMLAEGTVQSDGMMRADEMVPRAELRIVGIYCKKRHFNDPRVAYCATCGISMVQADGRPEWGSRPQLGVLLLDDGTMSPVVRDHVVGRAPDADPMVAAGLASAIQFPDPQLAPVHTRLVLDGWDVVVVDEANGTFVRRPGESGWTPLSKGMSARIESGTAVACGRRQFHFHSYRSSWSYS